MPKENFTDAGQAAFEEALQSKLMAQSEAISSSATGLEERIQSAITGVKTATELQAGAIESAGGRELAFEKEKAAQRFTTLEESQRGFAQNIASYRQLQEDTDKSLRDLEQRKQELVMQNNAAGASKIADLQLKSLEFKQNAMQQTFSNLLGMAQFGQQKRAQTLAEKAQTFNEKSQIAGIAMQYGVTLAPGDTIDSVVTRAAPNADKRQQMELARMASEIKLNQAKTAEALQGTLQVTRDPSNVLAYANAVRANPNVLSTISKQPDFLKDVVNKITELETNDAKSKASIAAQSGIPLEDFVAQEIADQKNYINLGRPEYEKTLRKAYKEVPRQEREEGRVTFPGLLRGGAETLARGELGVFNFLFGTQVGK